MPGNFQIICGSMASENRWSPASTETPDKSIIYHAGKSLLSTMKKFGLKRVVNFLLHKQKNHEKKNIGFSWDDR